MSKKILKDSIRTEVFENSIVSISDHGFIASLQRYYEIVYVLVRKDLLAKYRGAFLGYLWSILHPLIMALVFFFAFKVIIKIPVDNFALHLITGLFSWHWMSSSVGVNTWVFMSNASLIKKTPIPRFLLPMSTVVADMFHYLSAILVISFVLFLHGFPFFHLVWIIGVPMMLLVQFLLVYSFCLLFGSITVLFRDMERFVSLLLVIWMYITPLFYSLSFVPEKYRLFMLLNPMTSVVEFWRNLFMNGLIRLDYCIIALLLSLFWFLISIFSYKRISPKFAELL